MLTGQGLALYALEQATERSLIEDRAVVFPLWAICALLPLAFALAVTRDNVGRLLAMLGAFGLLLAGVAAYTGYQAGPTLWWHSIAAWFGVTVLLATFKALLYLQLLAERRPLSYPPLFTFSWRNFLVPALTALFVGIFWLVLALGAGLFHLIGITLFSDLFQKQAFLFVASGLAAGIGVGLFRELSGVIDSITTLLQGLIKVLLPLLVAVTVLFLAALPFTGLAPLWDTGFGTALLLAVLALLLFFVNAVYQDGRGPRPYGVRLHRLIYGGLCLMPALALLAGYGLYLRIGQYGWTVERGWAVIVCALLGLAVLLYVSGVLRRRDNWPNALGQANIGLGLAVLSVALLVNTPVLDLRKLALSSQLARLEAGEITIEAFDFLYAATHLGRPGLEAWQALQQRDDIDPDVVARVDEMYRTGIVQGPIAQPAIARRLLEQAVYRPAPFEVPGGVLDALAEAPLADGDRLVVIRAALARDGTDGLSVLAVRAQQLLWAQHFMEKEGRWQPLWMSWDHGAIDPERLGTDPLEVTEPVMRNLTIGDLTLVPAHLPALAPGSRPPSGSTSAQPPPPE